MVDTPTPQVETRWTEPYLVERIRALRGTLLSRGESATALAGYAPGGADNSSTDPFGGLVAEYALLRGRLAFLDWRDAAESARATQALDDALANAPQSVTCADGAVRAVHPKSYHALRWCDALDGALAPLRARLEGADPAHLEALALAPLAESLAVRLWAWILTHPDPGLPFDEGAPADPPAWTTALTPEDLLALWRAHHEVNRTRLALLAGLFPAEAEEESRLSLGGFLGTVAQELGQRPSEVLRRWSVGEALAQAVVAAQAAREARARAERDAA